MKFECPARRGARPKTTSTNPHTQLDQIPTLNFHRMLAEKLFALPDVEEQPSRISVPGARALWLADHISVQKEDAFIIGREFAHLHPPYDGSLHAVLPPDLFQRVCDQGWAEQHPMALRGLIPKNVVMIYAPRDSEEIETVVKLVDISRRYAAGLPY